MNLAEFHFIRPYGLLALLPWLVILIVMARQQLKQGNWSTVCDEALLPYILQQKAVNRSRLALTTGALASFLAIIAVSGPTWERLPAPVFRNDSALVIALDLSRSMDAADIKPSRLIRARYKIADILKQRKDGQTALLVYAADAFTVTPLTDDSETIASQLSALTTTIMPGQGSHAEKALLQAQNLLKQAGLQKGHILLITDGVNFAQTEAIVEKLGNYSLSILGVGTEAGAPIRAPEGGFVKDRQGTIVIPKLNVSELAKLAVSGGGIYQTISANDSDIKTLTAHFNRGLQENGEQPSDLRLEQWAEQGPWLLLLVLPLAALSFRKGLLAVSLVFLCPYPQPGYALTWQDLWQSQNQQAHQAFQAQRYEQAAEQFNDPQWQAAAQYKAGHYDQVLQTLKGIETADSFYNQGNALAQSGQLDEALKAYDKALKINPKHEDAQHNKDIVKQALEKQQQNQQQDNNQQGSGQSSEQDSEQDQQQEGSQPSEQPSSSNQSDDSGQQQANDDGQTEQKQQRPSTEKQQQDAEQQAAQPESEASDDNNDEEGAEQAAQADPTQPPDETQQANEQWLKRIPDDPAGLLRRKFLYQYGQRGRPSETDETW